MVEALAKKFGNPVMSPCGQTRYTFPGPERLASANVVQLSELGLGYNRTETVIAVAKRVCEGHLDLDALRGESYDEIISRLMESAKGIGYKIANCVALFALDKLEAFPVDTHIAKALRCYHDYPQPRRPEYPSKNEHKATVEWAWKRFGMYAGYAGQYLFHRQRQRG